MHTKTWLLCLCALLGGYQISQASSQYIICGDQPGEIYLTGLNSTYWGCTSFYLSPDAGQTLAPLDSIDPDQAMCWEYGGFVKDATEHTFHRIRPTSIVEPAHYLTRDSGETWEFIEDAWYVGYAAGVISGELYCRVEELPYHNKMQRSTDYGVNYEMCNSSGISNSFHILDAASGSDPGEVYVLVSYGDLYRSTDYCENFTFLNNVSQTWSIPSWDADLQKSPRPGEVYIFSGNDSGYRLIWRIYNYGTELDTIGTFPLTTSWCCNFAVSNSPGEVYFYAVEPDFFPGGVMRIYHTTNDGQSWEMFEHTAPNGVKPFNEPVSPGNLTLSLYPNPANASFNLQYNLIKAQNVIIHLINPLGQTLWQKSVGFQLPGTHTLNYCNEQLSSGTYLLRLQIDDGQVIRPITIVK